LEEIRIYNMAITRAQQAKQMLQDGGMLVKPSTDGKRPGYRNPNEDRAREEARDRSRTQTATQQQESYEQAAYDPGPSAPPSVNQPNVSYVTDDGRVTNTPPKNVDYLFDDDDDVAIESYESEAFEKEDPRNPSNTLNTLYTTGVPKTNVPFLNLTEGPRNRMLRRNIDFYRYDPRTAKIRAEYGLTAEGYERYMRERLAGEIDAAGNPIYSQDDDDPIIFPLDMENNTGGGGGGDGDDDTENENEDIGDLRAIRFRANGGRIGAMDGGIMGGLADGQIDEMGRQMYFLGKLVKKATRAIKKVAKSPVGKAALGLGGFYLGGGQLGGLMKGASKFGFLPQMMYGNAAGSGFGFGNIVPNILNIAKMPGLAEKAFSMGTTGKVLTGITAASVLEELLTPEQEKEAQELARGEGIDIDAARRSIIARAQGNIGGDLRMLSARADGGRIGYQEGSKEPVAKKTMPLLDMDGMEKDYREDGGFVPIGRMERADDVPARLSKNEFVFTADAVRNAGDGDVDKGAEVMYNMMKNLESGGDVSEESQGLQGAREMFQTSKRLEEVL